MRKTLAIVLISLHLFGNTEMGQIFSLPQLVRHYHFHQLNDRSTTFISFLIEHYSGDDGTTSDDKEDMKLPFHNIHHAVVSTGAMAPVNMHIEIAHPDFPFSSVFCLFRASTVPEIKTEVILQPPRPVC